MAWVGGFGHGAQALRGALLPAGQNTVGKAALTGADPTRRQNSIVENTKQPEKHVESSFCFAQACQATCGALMLIIINGSTHSDKALHPLR